MNEFNQDQCEYGVIQSARELDQRRFRGVGFVTPNDGSDDLYFDLDDSPDLRTDDVVSYQIKTEPFVSRERDPGKRKTYARKAFRIQRVPDDNPIVFRPRCLSMEPKDYLPYARFFLPTLPPDEQRHWLKERESKLSNLDDSAWDKVLDEALSDEAIWDKAPERCRSRLMARALEVLHQDYLASEEHYVQRANLFPPRKVFDCLRVRYVRDWVNEQLGIQLDDEQASVVAAVGGDIRVIARAGSGKTRSLTTRSAFLIKHCDVDPSEMLLLAFNKDAAVEMRNRLQEVLGSRAPHVMTFHALAYALVHPGEDLLMDDEPSGQLALSRAVQEVIDRHLADEQWSKLIRDLMLSYFRSDLELLDNPPQVLLEHLKEMPRETLAGEYVKSYGEKLIANILFENDVAYRYEANFIWSGVNYRPDFMIRTGENSGVVIEYFGLQGNPEYDAMTLKKREFWAQKEGWTLLDYSPPDVKLPDFEIRLLDELKDKNVPHKKLSDEEIWERVKLRLIYSFTKAVRQFVGRCRKRNYTLSDLDTLTRSHVAVCEPESQFLEVGRSVYGQYLDSLETKDQEDFDGLMWRAAGAVEKGNLEFVRNRGKERGHLGRLRFVMVDEFQDFSEMFFRLLQAIRRHNRGVEFFCVGDDWQAINAFAGSDLRFFHNFNVQWRQPSTRYIRTNWRSASAIVGIGNRLMAGRGELAHARPGAPPGLCQLADLEIFTPNPTEENTHEGDHITPAVLRLVQDCFKNGMNVALLTRRHGLPYYVAYRGGRTASRGLEAFEEHLKSFLPKEDHPRLKVSTTHSFKGLESPAVVVLDGIERSYPLLHPNWVFLRALGDSIEQLIQEERRLFYVALTRASHRLIVVTEGSRRSPFLDLAPTASKAENGTFVFLDWQSIEPAVDANVDECLEIRVEGGYHVKALLKADGFGWRARIDPSAKYWRKVVRADGFDVGESITSRPWHQSGIRVTVVDANGKAIHSVCP